MAAYLIAFVDVHDIERYTREYVPKILKRWHRFKARSLRLPMRLV